MAERGTFSEVEQNRRNQYEIKRRDKYLYLFFIAALLVAVGIMLSRTKELSSDFFLINLGRIKSFDDLKKIDFKIEYYFIFVIYISIIWHGLISEKPFLSKKSLIRKIGYIIFLPFNLLHKLYLKFLKKLNPKRKDNPNETLLNDVMKILYLPFNLFTFHYSEVKHFHFSPVWYGKIKKDFFKQTHNKVDEITRVQNLIALRDFDLIFTDEEYKKIIRLFKSEDAFIDYLRITEGYLTEEGKRKYDELFYSENINTLKKFRAFNGKDKVYFSFDYIEYKVDEQAEIFTKFLEKRFLKGSTRVSAEILEYFKMIVNDKNFIYNLVGIQKEDLTNGRYNKTELAEIKKELELLKEAKEKTDIIYIEKLLKERLVIWFKFYFARIILQRYCNIPSGLLVVKINDYSMRMITEIYNDKKTINIKKNQNDGSSSSFNGDGLVNLFLFVWNAFLYGRKVKILQDIEFNINTISDPAQEYDKDVEAIILNMEKEIKEQSNNN